MLKIVFQCSLCPVRRLGSVRLQSEINVMKHLYNFHFHFHCHFHLPCSVVQWVRRELSQRKSDNWDVKINTWRNQKATGVKKGRKKAKGNKEKQQHKHKTNRTYERADCIWGQAQEQGQGQAGTDDNRYSYSRSFPSKFSAPAEKLH